MTESEGLLYVSNYGDSSVSIIAIDSLKRVGTIGLDGRPNDLYVNANLGKLYITDSYYNDLVIYDLTNQKIVQRIGTDEMPYGLTASTNGDLLFIAGFGRNTLSIFDAKNGTMLKTFSTQSAFISHAGFNKVLYIQNLNKFYLTNTMNGQILVYSLSN